FPRFISPPVAFRPFDVGTLRAFFAATKQDHHRPPVAAKIDSVARTEVNAKLAYALTDGLPIAERAKCQAVHPANTAARKVLSAIDSTHSRYGNRPSIVR